MILILSERRDITTYHITKWLEYYGKEVLILTDEDEIDRISITSNDVAFSVKGKYINLKKVKQIEKLEKFKISNVDKKLLKGGGYFEGDGWLLSVSGECSKTGRSCWTMRGLCDWVGK